jgi:hypothetical protein
MVLQLKAQHYALKVLVRDDLLTLPQYVRAGVTVLSGQSFVDDLLP